MPEECLPREPQEHRAVLTDGPEHAQVLEVGVRLPENVHTPVFQLIQMVHARHQTRSPICASTFSTHSSTLRARVSSVSSGCSGGSYGSSIPVKFLTSPRRARA